MNTKRQSHRARLMKKGRRESGRFVAIPFVVLETSHYVSLGSAAKALLVDFLHQYNGNNNGDLSAAPGTLNKRGWSDSTLGRACDELLRKGFIVKTRQGGRNRCNLYGVTFHRIDDCGGKLDVVPTTAPLGFWKSGKNPWHEESPQYEPFARSRRRRLQEHGPQSSD